MRTSPRSLARYSSRSPRKAGAKARRWMPSRSDISRISMRASTPRCLAARVAQVACEIFVALAEEGWSEGEAVDAVTERYLAHLDARVDTVVLGCTHFPLLAGSIARQIGPSRVIVDSAATTARAVAAMLAERGLA